MSLSRHHYSNWPLCGRRRPGAVHDTGHAKTYASSDNGRRHFCADCGTGLFYTNDAVLPGKTDIQSGTLHDPDALPASAHIQVADRIGWMERAHELPQFGRYLG